MRNYVLDLVDACFDLFLDLLPRGVTIEGTVIAYDARDLCCAGEQDEEIHGCETICRNISQTRRIGLGEAWTVGC